MTATIDNFKKWAIANELGEPEEAESVKLSTFKGLPAIQLPGDDRLISEFAEELGGLIREAGIFARSGQAFVLDSRGQKLELVTPAWIRTFIESRVVPYTTRATRERVIQIRRTMADDTARAVLGSPQFLAALPQVERFHPCPMPWLRDSGEIELLPAGVDERSCTYTAHPGFEFAPMPLDEARNVIEDLLREFPWPQDAGRSRAVAVAAMLTVFAGGVMPPGSLRPVFFYVANAEGSGKTTLAQLAGIPYATTAAEPAPTEETEWQKRILALVVSGRRVALFDNVKGFLNSPSLEAYTSGSQYRGRILGVTRDFEGEAGASILVTGNGLTVTPDMRRRALFCELFMQELRAEDRAFTRRLTPNTIAALRPKVLSALWGIVRAWDTAGRPKASVENSHCPEWCDTVAGMVEFAGWGCPTARAEIAGMGDTDTADFAKLGKVMAPDDPMTFDEIATTCDERGLFERVITRGDDGSLTLASKSKFAKLLGRYDRRRVSATDIFVIEGKKRTRRYTRKRDGGDGGDGVSPS